MGEREDGQARWEETRRIRDEGMRRLHEEERERAERRRENTTKKLAANEDLGSLLTQAWERWQNAQSHGGDAEAEQATMELEEALVAAAIAWLSDQWGIHKPCPYCGNAEWTVGLPVRWAGPEPIFPVTCDTCGNTALINAILAGVVTQWHAKDL